MRHYLKYNQQARLFSWSQKNKRDCIAVTGQNPLMFISKLLAPMDLGRLPVAHVDYPANVQWWMDRHCPYPFIKSDKRKRNIFLSFKDWRYSKRNKK